MRAKLTGLVALIFAWTAAAAGTAEKVSVAHIDGPIGPATADYVARAIHEAESSGAECLVVQLDTPGGLLESTKRMVQSFYGSRVPVVVYVAPSGANATSAGCFLTLAADVAAMAPNTSIGAAHPIELGGGNGSEEKSEGGIAARKLENFAVSYIETIAARRGRNIEWARSAVRESASITSEQALGLKVIDLIATDLPDLQRKLDGRKVGDHVLQTSAARVESIPMLPRERVFQTLWRPEVMFLLMLIAIYGVIGELSNPGAVLPGVAGAIALVLALYMGSILPVSAAGLALIVLALALFVTDVFAPTHGALTAGGIISFFLGSLLLFEPAGPAFRLSLGMIVPGTLITAAFFVFVVGAGLRAQRLPHRAGREAMAGRTGPALTAIDADSGKVFVEGETWNARSETPIASGQQIEIVRVEGLTLRVKPKNQEEPL